MTKPPLTQPIPRHRQNQSASRATNPPPALSAAHRCIVLLLLAALMPLCCADPMDELFPVRGLSIGAPSPSQVTRFVQFIEEDLAPRRVNTLILRVDYNFQYESHPELRNNRALSRQDVRKIAETCRTHGIRIVPQINLLGHQSWATRTGNLLRAYPDFDETPWVKMPEEYAWPNDDGLYCKSYCPLHPKVHDVVFALVDELCDALDTDSFHAGMDEVFYIGDDRCPRCRGKDKARLFADEVTLIRNHLAKQNRRLWIWGDRLLDGKTTGLGEWEASFNDTHAAIDLIPKDVMICDWHYERPEKTAAYFALKGFEVATCPWKKPDSAAQQVLDVHAFRQQTNRTARDRVQGVIHTVWSGGDGFIRTVAQQRETDAPQLEPVSEAACFIRVFDEMKRIAATTDEPGSR